MHPVLTARLLSERDSPGSHHDLLLWVNELGASNPLSTENPPSVRQGSDFVPWPETIVLHALVDQIALAGID
jgi:hypothetical protein